MKRPAPENKRVEVCHEWLFGPEHFSGLWRNGPLCFILNYNINKTFVADCAKRMMKYRTKFKRCLIIRATWWLWHSSWKMPALLPLSVYRMLWTRRERGFCSYWIMLLFHVRELLSSSLLSLSLFPRETIVNDKLDTRNSKKNRIATK